MDEHNNPITDIATFTTEPQRATFHFLLIILQGMLMNNEYDLYTWKKN